MRRKQSLWRELTVYGLTALASCIALLWIAGCATGPQSDQQIRQNAARTTEQAKVEAKQAAAEAKVAAAHAARDARDIAAGVKEGLHSDNSAASTDSVDINSAGEARLTTLPGITRARARRIIANRPYARPRDLVSKGVLTRAEYDRISGDIVAGND
jgi:DNA uptake protein ComE-like DNA-binding protein